MALNRNIYIAIFLIGSVFAVLSLVSNYGTNSALTIIFLTITVMLLIRLFIEFRYYRSYHAPLAAGIFLLIPSIIAIGASYISRIASINGEPFLTDSLMYIHLDMSFFPINPLTIFSNTFSVIFSPFYIILLILFYRYYMGIYPRLFLMRKKFYKQFAMYYNISLVAIIVFIWLSTNSIEVFELVFVITSIVFIIRTYVFKIVLVPVRVVPTRTRRTAPRRSYTSPPSNQTTRSRGQNNSTTLYQPQRDSPTRSQSLERTRAPTPTPVRSQAIERRTPTPAPRQITTARTQVRPSHTTTPPSGSIEVVDGIPVGETRKTGKVSKINRDNVRDMIPKAQHLTEDDFRCIFCYELPTKSSDQVVICPNCKKPAHYPEYQKWTAYSNICSYCNQDVGDRTPKRISGKSYANIVKIALKSN